MVASLCWVGMGGSARKGRARMMLVRMRRFFFMMGDSWWNGVDRNRAKDNSTRNSCPAQLLAANCFLQLKHLPPTSVAAVKLFTFTLTLRGVFPSIGPMKIFALSLAAVCRMAAAVMGGPEQYSGKDMKQTVAPDRLVRHRDQRRG